MSYSKPQGDFFLHRNHIRFCVFFPKILFSLFVVCLNSKHGYSLCMLILQIIYATCRGESGKQLIKICANHMDFCCTHPDSKLYSKPNLNINSTKIAAYIC